MSENEKTYWECPQCKTQNSGSFCTNCGCSKPAETAVKKTAEPAEIAEPKPAPEPSPAPRPASIPHQPVRKTAVKEKSSSHPFLSALIAGIIGLCAGAGGGIFAVNRYLKTAGTGSTAPTPEVQEAAQTPAAADSSTDVQPDVVSPVTTGTTIQQVAASASKTVVEIQTENTVTNYGLFGGTYTSKAAGSGVIISDDGYIITNNHVVEGSQKITVKTYDGSEYQAELIGTDAKSDIAVIKIDATSLYPAEIGDSDTLQVGDTAIVIGNPLGTLGGTVTNGIISATNRDLVINNQSMTLLQTNAAINSGNSGGGMFDENGKLIGIVNAKDSGMTSNGTVIEGLGFAIPINTAYMVANELIEHGYVTSRPTIGVGLSTLDMDYGEYKAGLYITQIYNGSGAQEAGLQEYDRIISADGKEISSYTDVTRILSGKKVGDVLVLGIERDGEQLEVNVTLTGPLESMTGNN